jgi:hypothetical protein
MNQQDSPVFLAFFRWYNPHKKIAKFLLENSKTGKTGYVIVPRRKIRRWKMMYQPDVSFLYDLKYQTIHIVPPKRISAKVWRRVWKEIEESCHEI